MKMKGKFFIKMAIVIGVVMLLSVYSQIGFCASKAKLPKVITIASYPTGSLASMFVTRHGKTIEDITGIKVRPYPADTGIARLGPTRNGDAAISIEGSVGYYALMGMYEFKVKKWGPQRRRTVWGSSQILSGLVVRADSGIKTLSDLK